MAKRFKPTPRVLCNIGTLAHNRSFTTKEVRQYVGPQGSQLVTWLKKHKHIARSADGKTSFYPTKRGWKMVEKACGASPRKRRK